MDNKQVTAEWIAQQRDNLRNALGTFCAQREIAIIFADYDAALDALEASMQREADKDAEIARLTAERDAEKRRANAVPEIDLRPLQPGYVGVCTTNDEDGIQIRKVSHKHLQGRGYLDDDEDVQDVVVIRFAEPSQVMAVADRLLLLAETMAEKTGPCAENAPEGDE